jgi:hypothetical protein
MMFLVSLFLASLLSLTHIAIKRKTLDGEARVNLFLLYQFFFGSLMGLMAFTGHVFQPEITAARIGWTPHPQFQFELGAMELGSALASFLCLFFRNRHFWLAAMLPSSTLLLLAAALHFNEMISKGNFAPYNTVTCFSNILGVLLLAVPLYLAFRYNRAK